MCTENIVSYNYNIFYYNSLENYIHAQHIYEILSQN